MIHACVTTSGALVDLKAKELLARGAIQSLHREASFAKRLAAIAVECSDQDFADLAVWGLTLDTMYARLQSCFNFFFTPNLVAAVASVVGEEVTLNPIQHFRPFLPARNGKQMAVGAASLAPWHQDQGVTLEEADCSDILTCWIPLVDARVENGALRIPSVVCALFRMQSNPHIPRLHENHSGLQRPRIAGTYQERIWYHHQTGSTSITTPGRCRSNAR